MRKIIAIDPGHKKCGVVLADLEDLLVIEAKIVKKDYVIELIHSWYELYIIEILILGDGTTSNYWKDQLTLNNISPVNLVDETNTTLRARKRYLEMNPQRFFLQSFLTTLLLPPKSLDSVVALILIEDYLEKKLDFLITFDFKTWP